MRSKHLIFLIVAFLSLVTAKTSWGFSLLGPEPAWQVESLNYKQGGRDIGGWLEIGEEYRWNSPYITFGFDSSFINYYGTNGVKAVEEAFAIFNALPRASDMNFVEFPLESQRNNFQAQANNLFDLKSTAMLFIIEHLGLARPEIGVWRLRDRWIEPSTVTNYQVIQRNFDIYPPYLRTSYINEVLYTYDGITDIQHAGSPTGAFPRVVPLDPTAPSTFSTVAGFNLRVGGFFTGLTRDDVGGLAYLYRSNNFNIERLLPDVRAVVTNSEPFQLWTLDLAELIKNSQSTTNTPEQLLALTNYNNLSIIHTNTRLSQPVITTNRFAYYINYPWAPERVIAEEYTTNFVTLYDYEFENIVIYSEYDERPIFVRVSEVVPSLFHTPGLPDWSTNIMEEYYDTEFIRNGEFYIVPTNLVRFHFTGEAVATNLTITTNRDFFAETLLTTRTNSENKYLLTTDLAIFSEITRTNDPEALLELYPDLLILSNNIDSVHVISSNYVTFLTNSAWDPAVTFSLGHQWIITTNRETNYLYVFGNVVTNFGNAAATNTTVLVEETIVAPNPYDPAGSPFVTNFISSTVLTNTPMGNIYIVPTNLFGYHILSIEADIISHTNTFSYTNVGPGAIEQSNTIYYIRDITNYFLEYNEIEFVTTNDLATNIFGIRRDVFTFATNRLFEIYPVELVDPTNAFALRPGVEKLNFIRVDYESFLGPNFKAITNEYTDTVITEEGPVQQTIRRTSTRPDILFSVLDLEGARATRTSTSNWQNNDAINGEEGQAGPGIINPPTVSFNINWPLYINFNGGSFYLTGEEAQSAAWASFDGSTNAPIIYPQGTTLDQMESTVLNPQP